MKTPLFLLPALFLVSCEPPAEKGADPRKQQELEQLEAAKAAAEAERLKLEEETARLAAERDALEQRLRDEREARERAELEAREQEAAEAMAEAERRQQELALREAELRDQEMRVVDRETDVANREAELSDREMELAGREVIDDWTDPEPEEFRQPVADYGLFYDGLDSHGSWFDTPDYGYIFQPTVVVQDRSWRPYTHGRWICTNLGWTWASDEPFGWATYHYGRWVLLAGRGWCWVPGGEWAPAWVAWRHGGGHVGWAPLPPETLCATGRGWGVSVEVDFGIGDDWFCYVMERHMAEPIWKHCLPAGRNFALRRVSDPCTNLHYAGKRLVVGGPSYRDILPKVKVPWPVRQLDCDPLVGLGSAANRRGREVGNRWKVFTPNLDAPWNPGVRPGHLAGKFDRVEVVRGPGGVASQWADKYREMRQNQQVAVKSWAAKVKEQRATKLEENRQEVAVAQKRWEPTRKPARKPSGKPSMQVPVGGKPAKPSNQPVGKPDLPPGVRPMTSQEKLLETIRERQRQQKPGGVTRNEPKEPEVAPSVPVKPEQPKPVERTRPMTPQEKLAEALRERNRTARDTTVGKGGSTNDAAEKARMERERQAAEAAEQAKNEEKKRATAAERMREAQQKLRDQQEAMRRAAAERAEQQKRRAEEQRQANEAQKRAAEQEAARRRAAEEAAKQRDEMAKRQQEAAEQRAREERARQEEANRRAQEEASRRAQEEANRRAQEERSRKAEEQRNRQQERMREAQEKMREAQERMREKLKRNK
ncbi:prolin-richexported protein [Haloferula helveola]|uniref:Prolin-richexported protein n=1 Tax=Haloferula helveola TaxID=490095 RepID=A0ABM7RD19_9BACT|nr:prolin-richexported protein [Haloferula helveola]